MGPTEAERDLTRAVLAGVARGLWNIGRRPNRTTLRVRRYVKEGMPRMNTATEEKTENRSSSKSVSEKMAIAIETLKKISELPSNNKLRSWRGTEAVRLAKEALRDLV